MGEILLGLVFTVAVYSLPLIIYRYAVVKAPVEKKKAKKITIIYGICAFLVMSAIIFVLSEGTENVGAILLWSTVNYYILISGKKPIEPKTEILYCSRCGFRLVPDSTFCSNCGEPVAK